MSTETDPRYAPKTLADCATEFRAMMEDAIKRNEFEAAATCKTFLKAVEAAQAENAQMRDALTRITKIKWGWDGDCGAVAIAESALP
jgi:excinuclease UvrABC nuclease subunit